MLTIWNPFAPIVSRNEKSDSHMTAGDYFNRIFQSTLDDFFTDLYAPYKNIGVESQSNEDGSLSFYVDVPGIKEEDISVEIVDNTINIKGERKNRTSKYSINKSFTIPEGYNIETLKAELSDGVLALNLLGQPKVEKAIKKIEIKSHKALPEKITE